MYCCMPDLNLIPKFNYNTLLSCQVREILRIYRPTISFYEFINLMHWGETLGTPLGNPWGKHWVNIGGNLGVSLGSNLGSILGGNLWGGLGDTL